MQDSYIALPEGKEIHLTGDAFRLHKYRFLLSTLSVSGNITGCSKELPLKSKHSSQKPYQPN